MSESSGGLQAGDSQCLHSERPPLPSRSQAVLWALSLFEKGVGTYCPEPWASALLSTPSLKALSLDSLFPKQVAGGLTSKTLLQHHVAKPSWLSTATTAVILSSMRRARAEIDRPQGRGFTGGDFWPLPPTVGQMWRFTCWLGQDSPEASPHLQPLILGCQKHSSSPLLPNSASQSSLSPQRWQTMLPSRHSH